MKDGRPCNCSNCQSKRKQMRAYDPKYNYRFRNGGTRRFDGQRFQIAGVGSKTNANSMARIVRSNGYNARVIPLRGGRYGIFQSTSKSRRKYNAKIMRKTFDGKEVIRIDTDKIPKNQKLGVWGKEFLRLRRNGATNGEMWSLYDTLNNSRAFGYAKTADSAERQLAKVLLENPEYELQLHLDDDNGWQDPELVIPSGNKGEVLDMAEALSKLNDPDFGIFVQEYDLEGDGNLIWEHTPASREPSEIDSKATMETMTEFAGSAYANRIYAPMNIAFRLLTDNQMRQIVDEDLDINSDDFTLSNLLEYLTPKQIAKFNEILRFDEETAILVKDIEYSSSEDAETIRKHVDDRANYRKTYFYAISPSSSTIQPIDRNRDGRDDDTKEEMPGITIGSDVTYYKRMPEFDAFRRNIMGTISFNMKAGSMRKPQDFIVYPKNQNDGLANHIIRIQSDTRMGLIDLRSGKIIASPPDRSSLGNTFVALQMSANDGTIQALGTMNNDDRLALIDSLGASSQRWGDEMMITDNTGAGMDLFNSVREDGGGV